MNEFEKLLSSLGLGMDAEKHTVVDRNPDVQAKPTSEPAADDRTPVDPEDPWKRDAQGRFGKGNKGGPGNPYAREVAARQKQILEFYDEEKTDEVLSILHEMVLQRDKTAIRIVTSYVFNKCASRSGRLRRVPKVEAGEGNVGLCRKGEVDWVLGGDDASSSSVTETYGR